MAARSKYPWDNWTDGREHTIHRGRDYAISTYNLQISLHGRAKAKGLKVATRSFIKRHPDENGLMQVVEGLTFRFRRNDE